MITVFNATSNNISVIWWWSVFLAEETGVPGENHRLVTSHWQTLSHNVVSSTPRLGGIRTRNVSQPYFNYKCKIRIPWISKSVFRGSNSKEGLARAATDITDNLMALNRRISEQVQQSESTKSTLCKFINHLNRKNMCN